MPVKSVAKSTAVVSDEQALKFGAVGVLPPWISANDIFAYALASAKQAFSAERVV